jgi:HEAT repeat protein
MAITVECTNCHHAYKVDEKLVGQRVKCKSCGTAFVIEDPAPAPPPPDLDPFAEGAFDDAAEEKPAAKPAKNYSNPIETGSLTSSAKTAKPAKSVAPAAPALFQGFAKRSSIRLPIDKLTWLMLALLVLLSIGVGAYLTTEAYNQVKDSHIATTAIMKIWAWIALFDLLFAIVLTPLLWGGVFAAGKVMKFRIGDSAFLHAGAVTAIGVIIACLAEMSPELLRITLYVLLLPAIYGAIKIFFDIDWAESGGAVAFAAGGLLLGGIILKLLLAMVMPGTIFSAVDSAKQLALALPKPTHTDDTSSDAPVTVESVPALPPSKDPAVYAAFRALVLSKTGVDISQSTREEHLPDLLEMKRQLASLKAAFHDEPDWEDTVRRIEMFEQRVMALPSAKFDNAIYTDSPDAEDWTTGALSRGRLGPEISFRQFKLQPPAAMKLDLNSKEDSATGLIWNNQAAHMSIYSVPRGNAKQRKPVVSDKPAVLKVAQAAGLLGIDGANVTVAEGQLGGGELTVTRVIDNGGEHVTKYIVPAGDRWVIIEVHPGGDPVFARIVNAAARTLRQIEPGEAKNSPFSPALTALRLADDYEHASAILRHQGAAAEEAVDKLLTSSDNPLRQQALTYLKDNGTSRSLQALGRAALDPDPAIADLAKKALAQVQAAPPASQPTEGPAVALDPAKAGEIPSLMVDLNGNNAGNRKDAVIKLATIAPDPKNRSAVSMKLAEMLRSNKSGVTPDDLAAALCVWGDAGIGNELGPLLKEDADADLRHAAMKVLAALKDAKSAPAIVKWLKVDSGPTVRTLIAIGSGAEMAVLPSLKDEDAIVRIDAATILERIGTKKSLADLTRAAKDTKDVAAQQSAQVALDSVKFRTQFESDAPAPAPTPATRP